MIIPQYRRQISRNVVDDDFWSKVTSIIVRKHMSGRYSVDLRAKCPSVDQGYMVLDRHLCMIGAWAFRAGKESRDYTIALRT